MRSSRGGEGVGTSFSVPETSAAHCCAFGQPTAPFGGDTIAFWVAFNELRVGILVAE